MCPVFILNYKTTKIKTAWYWQKKKKKLQESIQQNREPRINAHTYLVNYSMTKESRIHNREMLVSSIYGAGQAKELHVK